MTDRGPRQPSPSGSANNRLAEGCADAAFSQLKTIYAKWLAGKSASEDTLFQIGDILQALSGSDAQPPSRDR